MKITHLTTLKHKLQWLVLLVALLGVSQGVWGANRNFLQNECIYFKNFTPSGWSDPWITSSGKGYVYLCNGNSNTRWIQLTLHSGTAGTNGAIYKAIVPAAENHKTYVFTRGSSSYTGGWSGSTGFWNQSGDITIDTSGKNLVETNSSQSYYAVAPSSCTISLGGSHSGSGTSADPYIVSSGESLTFTITATQADPGMTGVGANVNTTGSKASSAAGTSVTVSKTASSTAGTNENWTGYAWAYKNSTSTYSSSYATSSKIYTRVASACTTPTATDITISAPASATTIYLGTGSAPSITQTVTATCSKGNTYLWESNHTGYSYSGAWGSSTSTNVAFTSSSSKSTTATFYHEGEYTATFKAGCSNTTDASKAAPKITVKPGHIYFDGPFFSGSGYDLTKQHVAINTSTDQFVYEWTAAYTSGEFVISVGNACSSLATSAYTIGNYAEIAKTGVNMATSGNHNFSPNIGTINVGDRLKLTVSYTGVNSSGQPKYTVKLEKVCSNPTVQTVSGTTTICTGSSTNVTVASSQSNYTYKLYKDGSATSTTQAGTNSELNFSVSEAGAYTVHAYYTSGADAYCTADMSGTATVSVDAASVAGTISGGSTTLCSTAAKTLTLKNYTGSIQWHKSTTNNFTPSESTAISGATSATYSATPTTTTYRYKAVVTNGVCAPATTAQTSLLVRREYKDSDFTLSDNAQTYDGTAKAVTVALKANTDTTSTAGISTSVVTVYYTGTGTTTYAKSTTAPVNAGSYAVTIDVTKGSKPKYYCPATDISLGTDTIKKATQAALTISNTITDLVYCDAANVKLTTSGGSGGGAVTYAVTSGSGSVDGDVLSPSAKGSVTVVADKAASANYKGIKSAAKTFNFNVDAPTVYTLSNVGGATTICGDPSTGAGSGTLRLANSQTGYNYQLYSNGSPVEGYAAKAGTTGSSIDFPVTSSGTYTVYAYYGTNSSNCATQMDGEITLTISTQPKLVRSAASVTEYMPVTITSVSTDIAEWKIVDGSGNDVSSSTAYLFDQTYDAITFKGASTDASTPKTYTIKATTAGGCSETTTVTVNPDTESCS